MLRRAAVQAVLLLGVAACPAHAFNTYNGTDFPICVISGDHGGYREIVPARTTSKGWAIGEEMHLAVSVYNYSVCTEEGVCFVTCNDWPGESSCTTAPHTQQVVSAIHFPFDPQTHAGQEAAFLAGLRASFTLECNQ